MSAVSSLFVSVARAGACGWYDSGVTNPDDTAWAVAIVAVVVGLVWAWWVVPEFERRRQVRQSCSHTLVLDAVSPPNVLFSTLRCSKGCGYQEPAREHIAKYEEARQDRLDALRIAACPSCGSTCR